MKYIFFSLIFFLVVTGTYAQDMTADQINQKMTDIRQSTNWDDPVEAKKANEEIKKLSKQLMLLKQKGNATKDDQIEEIKKENVEHNAKLWNQMMKSFEQGKDADILLAEPLREEIIEEYKDDESPIIKSQDYLDEMTMLVIDMSLKTVQRTIDQMEKFKSIKTLIITGGKFGTAVDLQNLLNKAKNYPLEELYIINFKIFVNSIPKQIKQFKNLKLLSILNNNVNSLPAEVENLKSLKTLYVDINPLTTLLPTVGKLNQLENLGIGQTNIAQSEIDKIKQLLPNCKILLQ
jgi:Leucine-rich repeat (LRR) protein